MRFLSSFCLSFSCLFSARNAVEIFFGAVIAAADKKGISVVCGDGQILRITELQAAGGKRMSAAAYLLGHPIHAGEM